MSRPPAPAAPLHAIRDQPTAGRDAPARNARDDRAARAADGAQRVRDRRDDPGAAGHRPLAPRRRGEPAASWSWSLTSSASARPSCCGGRSPTASAASRSWPPASRLYAVFALLCGLAGSFALLIAGRIAMGASAAVTRVLVIVDGPRPVRGRGHGPGDEPRVHDLHAGAGACAEHRPGDPAGRAVAGDLRRARRLRAGHAGLVVDPAARDAPPRISAARSNWREMGGAMLGDDPRTPVARLHAGDDGHLRRRWSPTSPRSSRSCSTCSRRRTSSAWCSPSIAAPMALASCANRGWSSRFGLRRVGHAGALLLRARHRGARGYRAQRPRNAAGVHRPAGPDDGLLRLHLVQLRHAGDGAYGADRRHRLVGPGRRSAPSARR